jgi:hypothetical protein
VQMSQQRCSRAASFRHNYIIHGASSPTCAAHTKQSVH